ncbi:2TM domain-containing protein [Polaribacter sp. Asnod1-A03]|uniref:2TM domain-containing protein n=1 Tax=Polaribacter sp. Asnod1-A03 TaxID=3160581 RepID=UPI00386EE40F
MKTNLLNSESYIKAKKRTTDIKSFYTHVIVYLFLIPVMTFINLKFTPEVQWFWFVIAIAVISLLSHWFIIFGLKQLGFSKKWEQKKINEYMKKQNYKS